MKASKSSTGACLEGVAYRHRERDWARERAPANKVKKSKSADNLCAGQFGASAPTPAFFYSPRAIRGFFAGNPSSIPTGRSGAATECQEAKTDFLQLASLNVNLITFKRAL